MMSIFDRADVGLAAAVGRLLNSNVSWQPMRAKVGSNYTNDRDEPDPTRPLREGLTAIVTWRPEIVDSGDVRDQGTVTAFACLVDFELVTFEREGEPGVFDLPRKGDHFILEDEYEGNNVVQIGRNGDDGSMRVFFYCNVPE